LIAQRRFLIPETLAFLAEALGDSSPDVWKNALDGIVTLGGAEAAVVLSAAKSELKGNQRYDGLKRP
jgi:hypothetical protein